MTRSQALALTVSIILGLSACGGSDGGSSDGDDSEQSVSEADEAEVTTLSALSLDVPSGLPAEFPLPGDTVLVKVDPVAGSDFVDVTLGTTVSRTEIEAIITPYLTALPNGRYADSAGYAFSDDQEISLFVHTCEDCDSPPTLITFRVPSE
jgi:hypothetical protein